MEPLQVIEQIAPRLVSGPVVRAVHALPLEYPEEPFTRRVVAAVADRAHAADQCVAAQEFLVRAADELGGFNRSSQHLQPGGVYGTTRRLDEAIDRERRDALSGCAFAST